jgi:hypothetical protein
MVSPATRAAAAGGGVVLRLRAASPCEVNQTLVARCTIFLDAIFFVATEFVSVLDALQGCKPLETLGARLVETF